MDQLYSTAPQVLDPVEIRSEPKCDTHEIETSISCLGETVEVPVNVRRYATCHNSVIDTGKEGSDPGELLRPRGVSIQEETHQIFVVNQENDRVEIFSEAGEFIRQLGIGQLSDPWGIVINGNSLYASCWGDHTVSKFSLIEMCRVRKIGGKGLNNGQFNSPSQLATDPIGRVFIADSANHRICIHDPDLNHLRNIAHESFKRPFDVKVSRDRLYVLCPNNKPCMLVLTLEGEMLHSLISVFLLRAHFFCLDPLNNFLLSDDFSHSIRVFSPDGNIIQTMKRPGQFYTPEGVAVTPNGKLVCVSGNMHRNMDRKYGLQIY